MTEKKLKQDDIITINIIAMGNDSSGIAHWEDYTLFVPFSIIGDTLQIKITYVKGNIAYAKILSVIKASEYRIEPRCKVYGKCGGCSLQHVVYDEQLKLKKNIFEATMKKVGGVAIESLPAYPSKPYGYRNKLVIPVSEYKGNIKTGFYEYNSHNIVATEICPLHADWSDKVIKDIKQYMRENNERGYDYRNNKGDIRHIVARYICNQLLLVLVTNNPQGLKNYKALSQIIAKDFNSYGIYQSINTMDNNIVMGKTVDYLYGIKEIQGSACNKEFTLKPNSFFQINDEIRDVLYTTVRDLLKEKKVDVVIDAYSGAGILTAMISDNSYDTIGVEIVQSATIDADMVMKLNNCPRQKNINGDVKKILPDIFKEYKGKRIGLIVDPVRKGMDEEVCRLIAQLKPDAFIYISCNPATQARDIARMKSISNMEISYARVFDQFPETISMESIIMAEFIQ